MLSDGSVPTADQFFEGVALSSCLLQVSRGVRSLLPPERCREPCPLSSWNISGPVLPGQRPAHALACVPGELSEAHGRAVKPAFRMPSEACFTALTAGNPPLCAGRLPRVGVRVHGCSICADHANRHSHRHWHRGQLQRELAAEPGGLRRL